MLYRRHIKKYVPRVAYDVANKLRSSKAGAFGSFKFIPLSPWTDSWKDFYVKNYATIQEKLDNLKSGMDDESKEIAETLWEKIVFLIPYNRYKKSFLYKTEDFFTENELRAQRKRINYKYKFPGDVNVDPTIFSTKNGLIFLDSQILTQIKGRAIIDGGAYIGDSAMAFCEFGPSKIYSFEPVASLHAKINATLALNKMTKLVEPIRLGLSNSKQKLNIYGDDSTASITDTDGRSSKIIETTTIDDFVEEKNTCVGLIKLDIEGSELAAIEGALETIRRDKPILLISIYHRPEDFFFIKPMIDKLGLGYKFMMRKTSPFRVTSETVLIGYVEENKLFDNDKREKYPKVLAAVNHYYGKSNNFVGKSSTQDIEKRKNIVQRTISALREIPNIDIKVCGMKDRALIDIDIDFTGIADPAFLVYESIEWMAGQAENYDYFINIEDDVLLTRETFERVLEFDKNNHIKECFHPNRMEYSEGKEYCVDLKADPKWTDISKNYKGKELRVAANPHSGISILSKEKLIYAKNHVDLKRRDKIMGHYMASAYANLHEPFRLFRAYSHYPDHKVIHLDNWNSK